jgi:hypothetical protein
MRRERFYFFVAALIFSFFLVLSYQLWLNDLRIWGPHHFIPDGHGLFAEKWHQFLSEPGAASWNELTAWTSKYFQASSWLTAFLVSLAIFMTGSTLHAFFWVSATASALTSYFLYRYLKGFLGIKDRQCLIILILFWSHLVVLYSLLQGVSSIA